MTLIRAAALGLAALAGYAAIVITASGQASAATAYRYWAYYIAPSATAAHGMSWQYSQRGPATEYPVDGEVQGWRFAVQADAANGLLPRSAPDFATLCAANPPKAGELRVGIVIDFGLAADAPAHERPPAGVAPGCVYVREGETGANVLQAAAAVRIGTGSDTGLVCGIDGYPKTECAVAVATHASAPPSPQTASPTHSPTQTPTTPTTRASAPTPVPAVSAATTPQASPATAPTAAAGSVAALAASPAAPSAPGPASASGLAPSFDSAAPSASGVSLATLRSNSRHSHGVEATTIGAIALIVILGGGAVWRARARGR